MSNDSKNEVSIGFHKAIHFAIIPWIIVSSFISLIISFEQNGEYAFLDLISFIGPSILGVICFIGFFGWKQYAWYTIHALIWFLLINNSVVFLVYLIALPDAIASVTPPLVYGILGITIVRKYYIRLKPRFFPEMYQPEMQQPQIITSSVISDQINVDSINYPAGSAMNYRPSGTICFCRKCGERAMNQASFCTRCGTKLDWRT
ncbi:MAG: zinc ribbon domain-containing protein [Ruminococcaceae bacterium]|nr:zinc ribbon domain-containing protein [Oscillospiraceae bacterium]